MYIAYCTQDRDLTIMGRGSRPICRVGPAQNQNGGYSGLQCISSLLHSILTTISHIKLSSVCALLHGKEQMADPVHGRSKHSAQYLGTFGSL